MHFKSGRKFIQAVGDYVNDCRERSEGSKKPIFANVAGFCRFAGISVAEYRAFSKKFPDEYENAAAFFEDAALNSGATATLVGMYLREYGYWGREAEDEVICDHDIFADGE